MSFGTMQNMNEVEKLNWYYDPSKLTDRENEVLAQRSLGLTNAEAGEMLGIKEGTVKNYMTGIIGKLNAPNANRCIFDYGRWYEKQLWLHWMKKEEDG